MERSKDHTKNTKSDDKQVVKKNKNKDTKDTKGTANKLKAILKNKFFIGAIALFLVLSVSLAVFVFIHIRAVMSDVSNLKSAGSLAMQSFEQRDLQKTRESINESKKYFNSAYNSFLKTKPLRFVPVLKNYWLDVDRVFKAGNYGFEAVDKALSSIEPYADILGFTGAKSDQVVKSAEDRIVFIAETAKKLEPEIDEIASKLELANNEISQIDPSRYPKQLMGKDIRNNIIKAKETLNKTTLSIAQFRPIIKILPDLLGNPEPRKYLLLFQNDAELRPTGGFMTAYATMKITKGKIEPGVSQDIYTLDSKFGQKVPAPEPIKKYLPLVYYWNLRDMNLSPDFKVSMDTFTKYYKQVPGYPEVDAIIAIDTEVPVRILRVLGPIGVPGYGGKFSAELDSRYNIPQVIYALENIITKPTYEIREGRKSILGPLMNSMLANILNSPKSKWPEFFNIFTESIREKHLLMYFFDEEKQKAVEVLQAGGRILEYDGDYLHINDTNFAGAKSNLFVKPEVEQEVTVKDDGSLHKKITITYRNETVGSNCNLEAGQLCLNGILRDWIRIYVPKGSKLISFRGSEVDPSTSEDLGKTVFEGFFTIAPQSVKKLHIEYETPPVVKGNEYRLLIQKQPGKKTIKHTIILNDTDMKEINLSGDTEVVMSL